MKNVLGWIRDTTPCTAAAGQSAQLLKGSGGLRQLTSTLQISRRGQACENMDPAQIMGMHVLHVIS